MHLKKRDINSYLFRQIVSYDENDFIDHIKKHTADSNCDKDDPNKNIFSTDFPVDKIIDEIKKYGLLQ